MTWLTNKIFLHTNTRYVQPSEILGTLYPLFYIAFFRETTSTELTIASCSSSSVESSAKGTVRSVSESECQSWISANLSLPSFWRTKKSIRRKSIRFGFTGLFDFHFLNFCQINSFSLLFHHEDLAVGSGLEQFWYLKQGEPQQKRTAKN